VFKKRGSAPDLAWGNDFPQAPSITRIEDGGVFHVVGLVGVLTSKIHIDKMDVGA
jgi:hypothetical protein